MTGKEISYQQARQKAEQSLRNALSKLNIHPTVSLLEERYAENSVCWIFFRNRAINISIEDAWKSFGSSFAFAVSKWGELLQVPDNFNDEEKLKIQMDRFATVHPDVRPDRFRQLWGIDQT